MGSLPLVSKFGGFSCAMEQLHHIMKVVCDSGGGADLLSDGNGAWSLGHFLYEKIAMIGQTAEASMVGTTRKTLARFRRLSAASAMLMNMFDAARMLLNLAQKIKSRGGRCLSLIEKYKSDETSLFFNVSDTEGCHAGGSGNALAVVGPSVQATCKQKARNKVLQSHRELAALFEVDADHRVLVRTFITMPLQVMPSTKMEVYLKCFQHTFLPISELKAFFERHIRLCTTDGDGAVAAGLRGVAHMSDDVRQVHQKFDIHKLSNKLTSMTSPPPIEMHVSSLIDFSLSLQAANTMRSFREAL